MKYLPALTLGFLIFFTFFFFSNTIKAASSCERQGEVCEYIRQDGRMCQGICPSSLVCGPGSDHDYCFPGTTTPTPVITNPPPTSGIIIGVQLPKETTIRRLLPSQYSFQWVKFQYSLGSDQPLEQWINYSRQQSSGGGNTYQVLISVAKNTAGIETLKNPDTYPPEQAPEYYTHKYCPYEEELETYSVNPHNCGIDPISGEPQTCYDSQTAQPKSDNGYIKFRDQMEALAPRLNGASAVEIWNEPNLEDEWTHQGLGPVKPENYVNFMNCGIKGLRKGGYNGTVISAGLAPNAYATSTGQTNMNDLDFFREFKEKGGLNNINAIGWHANITSDIPPKDRNNDGFQRVGNATRESKPVWLTEFGWDRSTFHKANDFEDRQLQAQYIAQAYEVAKEIGNIKGMFVWNFGFTIDAPGQPEFAPWDIEGTTPRGLLCQPNPPRDERASRDRADTKYVQDVKTASYPYLVEIANRGLIPEVVVKDVDQEVLGVTGTKVDVTKSFLSELLGFLNPLQNFLCTLFAFLGNDNTTFCTPNLSIGKAEPPSNAEGKNTQEFAAKAEVLGKANIPTGMTLIPEVKDCNIGKLGTTEDPGEKKLNEISEYLGTAAGFYGNSIPDFKTIAAGEWGELMDARMKTENLNVGTKLFQQDQRDPDLCLRLKNKIIGSFPTAVFPPNMTCDDVYNLILLINRSHYL